MVLPRRYESALQKANYASLALKEDASAAGGDEEEDEELYETLARARRAAQAKSTAAVRALVQAPAYSSKPSERASCASAACEPDG